MLEIYLRFDQDLPEICLRFRYAWHMPYIFLRYDDIKLRYARDALDMPSNQQWDMDHYLIWSTMNSFKRNAWY